MSELLPLIWRTHVGMLLSTSKTPHFRQVKLMERIPGLVSLLVFEV